MNEEIFNLSIRKFLKTVGVSSQREIEQALAKAIAAGTTATTGRREPWYKGKIVGQKAPFKLKDIWVLRVRLQLERRVRELALFDFGIDSKLRGCDLVKLKVRDICQGEQVATRAIVPGPWPLKHHQD